MCLPYGNLLKQIVIRRDKIKQSVLVEIIPTIGFIKYLLIPNLFKMVNDKM